MHNYCIRHQPRLFLKALLVLLVHLFMACQIQAGSMWNPKFVYLSTLVMELNTMILLRHTQVCFQDAIARGSNRRGKSGGLA